MAAAIIGGALVDFSAGCSVTLVSCVAGAFKAAQDVGAGCGGVAVVAAVCAFVEITTAIVVVDVSAAAAAGGLAGVIAVVITILLGVFNTVAASRWLAVVSAGVRQSVGIVAAVVAGFTGAGV